MNPHNKSDKAIDFVKKNQKEIIARFIGNVMPVAKPISIFMAGSPGAGKTEFSTHLIGEILGAEDTIVRIDPDEIRMWLPDYEAGKAEEVQGAVSLVVNKLHDFVKRKSYSFLMDGTFSKIERARTNVKESIDKGRPVIIEYVIQPPEIAWQYTQDREKVDGRNIRKEDFVHQFLSARDCVSTIKAEFGNQIQVNLIERDIKSGSYKLTFNVDNLDKYLPKKYSKSEIERLL